MSLVEITSVTIPVAAAIISVGALYFAREYAKKSWLEQKKQTGLTALLSVHEMVRPQDAREARAEIYKATDECKAGIENPSDADYTASLMALRRECSDVTADLDIIGSLVYEELVPRDEFLRIYAKMVIKCWTCLRPWIEAERNDRPDPRFAEYFQWLATKAQQFKSEPPA